MSLRRMIALTAMAASIAACSGDSGPAPVATIDPRPFTITEAQVEYESQAAVVGPVTFIEFYAEW